MFKKFCMLFFVLVLLVGCSSQNFEPALVFEIPETELPLAEPGPYEVGKIFNIRTYDESRDDRKVTYSIYYPAIDNQPDTRGAPFPVIINSGKMHSEIVEHLVSHGFVVVRISGIDYADPWDDYLVEAWT